MNNQTTPGLPRRLAAMVYDIFLILPLIMLVVALTMGARTGLQTLAGGSADGGQLHPALVQLLALMTTVAFYTVFWRIKGQTLGMQAWRIQLQSVATPQVSIVQCLTRCLSAAVSLLPLGLGFWWCLIDKQGRYWHDRWSQTQLVLIAKK